LLDLCIPAKPGRGGASEDFVVILLTEIQRIKKPFPPQVYMMTADRGRKLTKIIEGVLSTSETELVPIASGNFGTYGSPDGRCIRVPSRSRM